MSEDRSTWKTNLVRTGLWFVAIAGIFFDAYYMIYSFMTPLLMRWRYTVALSDPPVNMMSVAASVDNWRTPLTLVIGLMAVGFVIGSEYYLRKGEKQGQLMHHAAVVYGSIILALFLMFLIVLVVTSLVPLP